MGNCIPCSLCGLQAFYFQPYSGSAYCHECFPKALERRVRDHINHRRLLRPDDRIAVAVSGGKDSVSLLHMLAQIEKEYPKASLIAVSVDEGINGYRKEALDIAAQNAAKIGVEHQVLSFKSLYGYELDEIVNIARAKKASSFCAFCGILRRKALNIVSKTVGATVLVTAHNLDDEAQSILMTILRGDSGVFIHKQKQVEGFVRRVKPLSLIPERETALYAYLMGIRFQTKPCPYAGTSLRNDVRTFLDILEEKHPGMKFNLQATLEKLQLSKNVGNEPIQFCKSCGEPSSREICRSCNVLQGLGILR